MAMKPIRAAVVGAGIISSIYLKNMVERFEILEITDICSARMDSARKRAAEFGITARSYREILSDSTIEMIINLTPVPSHEEIIRSALEAGKHVYTEKTMTGDYRSAKSLSRLAKAKGLFLGSAPDTFLGAAQQTARAAVDAGEIGGITSFAFASNRDNSYLTSYYRFLNLPSGGVGYDYSVYYLTALVNLLGPVAQVASAVRAPYQTHIDINPASVTFGQPIPTPNESEISAVIRLENGICGTVHFNNDTISKDQAFMAVYGTKGILYLPDPNAFGGDVRLLRGSSIPGGQPVMETLPCRHAFSDNSRGVGPADMAWAIRQGRPCRASAEIACHVLETIDAIITSGKENRFVDVHSRCERPAALSRHSKSEETCLID